jgi:hypothetical protein
MKGFERNVRFSLMWVRRISFYTYIAAFALVLWFWFLDVSSVNSVSDFILNYIGMSASLGAIYIFLYTAINVSTVLHQEVSYGSTRKGAAVGMILTNLMTIAAQLIINGLLYVAATLIGGKSFMGAGMVLFVVNIYLILAAIAPLASIAVFKLGKIGYYVIVVGACFIMGGFAGFLIGGINSGAEFYVSLFFTKFLSVPINLAVMAAAVVCIALTGALLVFVTRNMEVKM